MEDSKSSFSHRRENIEKEDEEILAYVYDADYIKLILERETSSGLQIHSEDRWIQTARLEGIHYILKRNAVFGFGFQTIYLSVTYLDRFLSKKSRFNDEDETWWTMPQVSMACLSLAAKMEEYSVPPLSEFWWRQSMMESAEEYVLSTLEWRMTTVTPFAFTHFFAEKLALPATASSATVDLVLDAVIDHRIMWYKPSVIAAAATVYVWDESRAMSHRASVISAASTLTADVFKITTLNSLKLEDIISCYDLFQQMKREKHNQKRRRLSRGSSVSFDLFEVQNYIDFSCMVLNLPTQPPGVGLVVMT